jgi:hypothetical protein
MITYLEEHALALVLDVEEQRDLAVHARIVQPALAVHRQRANQA